MNRTFFINLLRSLSGVIFIWYGGFWLSLLAVLVLSVFSLKNGFHGINTLEEPGRFKQKSGYYKDFVIGFDLMLPPAMFSLWVAEII